MYAFDRLCHLKRHFTTFDSLSSRKRIKNRLCATYDETLTVFSSYGIITCDSLIYVAYGHRNTKYTYIDTTRQSYRCIARSYNDREATYLGVISRRSKFDSISAHAQSVI